MFMAYSGILPSLDLVVKMWETFHGIHRHLAEFGSGLRTQVNMRIEGCEEQVRDLGVEASLLQFNIFTHIISSMNHLLSNGTHVSDKPSLA
jgi:hypothetical protein